MTAVLTVLAHPADDCAELQNGLADCPGLLPLAGAGAVWAAAALLSVAVMLVAISVVSVFPTGTVGSWFEERVLGLDLVLPQTAPDGLPPPGTLPPADAPTPGEPEPQVAPEGVPPPGVPDPDASPDADPPAEPEPDTPAPAPGGAPEPATMEGTDDDGGDAPDPDEEGEPPPPDPPGDAGGDPDVETEAWVRFYLHALPRIADVLAGEAGSVQDAVRLLVDAAAAQGPAGVMDAFDAVDDAVADAEETYARLPETLERLHRRLIRLPALTDLPFEVGVGFVLDELEDAARHTAGRLARLSAALDEASDGLFPAEPAEGVEGRAVEYTDAVQDATASFAASAARLKDLLDEVPPAIWERLVFDPRTSDRFGPTARGVPGVLKGTDDILGLLKPPKPLTSNAGNGLVGALLVGVVAWRYGTQAVQAAWERISDWWSSRRDDGAGADDPPR